MDVHCKILEGKDSLKYREARLESLRLHPKCFGSGYEAQSKLTKLYFEDLIDSGSQDSVMIGTFVRDELVGLCGLTPKGEDSLELIQMYVFSNFRGIGIGEKMINFAKQILETRNKTELRLTVFTDNFHAIKMYERVGFEEVKTVENELVMSFKL